MAPSRGLPPLIFRILTWICPKCQSRSLTTTTRLPSGHSRWSKIKHDKGKADAAKNRQRSIFAHELATASRLFGGDPNTNPRLADLITKAKKEGFAKASIEGAIARGQGKSVSGTNLESVTVEGILPNNVAVIIECETDSKLRTLSEVRLILKNHEGAVTPTSYLFEKKGKITFEAKDGIGVDEVLEAALEAGALDVDEEDGRVVVSTEPGSTRAVGEAVSNATGLQIAMSNIFWDPNEDTKVDLADETAVDMLASFVDELQEKETSLQSISVNLTRGDLDAAVWKDLQNRIAG